ncbi:hypothetical protein DOTSEDRAFT_179110 [Dothistroma septosporum NZE10]|uniref:DUF7730 domain-containing protein n=1 Tax=Dothistroma septosporum (strain NZE10 / CBS 128990) TaxID=675120 RepID=N1PDI2_DOTSN|nr:hypothetical protein DOTSEDRAFT_179110 [Dothistroma septosporum NZE10]
MTKGRAGHDLKRRPVHSALPPTDTSHPVSQEQSPLFGLPAELRNRIYEYVFGSGTIHVRLRQCEASSKPLLCEEWEAPENGQLSVNVATKWRNVTQYSKLSYAICEHPDQWDRAYKLSQAELDDELRANRDPEDRAYQNHNYAHYECISIIEYLSSISTRGLKVRQDYSAVIGERLAHSKLHLSILQTCRQIYHEAQQLPFLNYALDIPYSWISDFATRVLYTHQASSVHTLLTRNIWEALEFKTIMRSFPKLKKLCIANEACMPLTGSQQEWRTFFNINTLESVEVFMGTNRDNKEQRAWFNGKTEVQEKFLVRPMGEEERRKRAEYAKIVGKMPKFGAKMNSEHGE